MPDLVDLERLEHDWRLMLTVFAENDRADASRVVALIAEDRALRELVRKMACYTPPPSMWITLSPTLAALLAAVVDGRDE